MSQILINAYLAQLDDLRKVSGSSRESVVREAFKDLLKGWARSHDLVFVPEYEFTTLTRERRYADGALLHALRVPFGYWEAKDEKDDLDAEIETKFRRGYPQDNIIFEDSREAVLIQNRHEVFRCAVDDVQALEKLLNLFFGYERPEIAEFRKGVEQFKTDLPAVLEALREMIARAHGENAAFRKAAGDFLVHAQEAINPSLTDADVREMLIQHILTEEIFSKVFGEDDFHRQNNVAKELYKLEGTFFTGNVKKQTLRGLDAYYAAIRSAAAQIGSHHEKQTFLKVIYENFYKVYNVKMADRLGVVYTPNEIVRFMIDSADWLTEKHFGKNLVDKDVEILDPATGTGTFICELLEHFRGQRAKLKHKYREELHANEVAILPYYVANLNIEATYAAITGEYVEFPNLCFVDTLDNVGLHTAKHGSMGDLFGSVSEENVARIKRQNSRKISVIIGNPPYNANQLNENENNKNREYPVIDKRIKQTYIDASTAQKTKLYDMYARFFRWASDRLNENGVLAFISNRSFIDSRTFDGFRKIVANEFDEIRVVDLGGDVRANPKLSGTKHNVFGIQTGVAISFMVKKSHPSPRGRGAGGEGRCRIFYTRRPELETAEEKLAWLGSVNIDALAFEEIRPDAKHNWINLSNNDFDELMPIASKETKAAKKASQEKAVFKLYSLGIVTNRDEWAYDDNASALSDKIEYFCAAYTSEMRRWAQGGRPRSTGDFVDRSIKWTSELEAHMRRGTALRFDAGNIVESVYRPFVKRVSYFAPVITHRPYQNFSLFPHQNKPNLGFSFAVEERADFGVIALDRLPNKDMFIPSAAQVACLYRYDDNGNRIDNITDWALAQFRKHYKALPHPHPDPLPEGEGTKLREDGEGMKLREDGEGMKPRGDGEGMKVRGDGEGMKVREDGEGMALERLLQEGQATASSLSLRERVGVREKLPLSETLLNNARELRKNQTDAEKLLWSLLRNSQLGVKFRRQHPIGKYILDFYCDSLKLTVELDGGQHAEEDASTYDRERTGALGKLGITVLRFWNNDVLSNTEGVLTRIFETIQTPAAQFSAGPSAQPSPAPSPAARVPADRPEPLDEREACLANSSSHPQPSPGGRGRTREITKEAIFHYVYGALHDPIYREKYAQNLKREFPRIPFYADFWQWAHWGKELMDLHIGYESVQPWPLTRTDVPTQGGEALKAGTTKSIFDGSPSPVPSTLPSPRPSPGGRGRKEIAGRDAAPRAILRADMAAGRILLDSQTSLSEIPASAWDYRLGNRSALEWILDQYKEKKPKDPTIREKFDTYRFADYKDKVIDLLMRVTRVSVETQRIVEAMRAVARRGNSA